MHHHDINELLLSVQNSSFKELNVIDYDFLIGIYRKLLIRQPSESTRSYSQPLYCRYRICPCIALETLP